MHKLALVKSRLLLINAYENLSKIILTQINGINDSALHSLFSCGMIC